MGIKAPLRLCHNTPAEDTWQNPDLVLSQTCGMPFRLYLHKKVTLIGTPDYGLPNCPPGYYNSVFVVRKDQRATDLRELAKATFAYNHRFSQSGFAAAYLHMQRIGAWFEHHIETGSHRDSALAVYSGQADIACLDAQSFRLISRHDEFSEDLTVLQSTQPSPGLPFISRLGVRQDLYFSAIKQAIDMLAAEYREQLNLHSLVSISTQAYVDQPDPPRELLPLT